MFATSVQAYGEKILHKGEILDKQNVLIRLLNKKFGTNEENCQFIRTIDDGDKLDKALEELIFAESEQTVLDCLQ